VLAALLLAALPWSDWLFPQPASARATAEARIREVSAFLFIVITSIASDRLIYVDMA
jgi:hypothetical protein